MYSSVAVSNLSHPDGTIPHRSNTKRTKKIKEKENPTKKKKKTDELHFFHNLKKARGKKVTTSQLH